jgi:hypothetical protein
MRAARTQVPALCAALDVGDADDCSPDDAAAPHDHRSAAARAAAWCCSLTPARLRALLRLPLRMPGSFPQPALEAAWLADVAAHRCMHDAICYAFCATIHLVELIRMTPPALLLRVAQLAYVRARAQRQHAACLLCVCVHACAMRQGSRPC